MWLREQTGNVVMCIKVWKELQRTLLPVTPRNMALGLLLGSLRLGRCSMESGFGGTVTGETSTQGLGSHWVAYEHLHT